MTEPRWLDPEEARMWRGFHEMSTVVAGAVEQQLVEHGLSGADYALLVPLSESGGAPLRARDLARQVGWDRSRLSHQLRRMEARGLLARSECPEDARGTLVGLTSAGQSLVEAAAPGHVEAVRRVFVDLLSPDEVAVLADVFARVRDTARAPDGACDGAAADPCG